MGSAGKGVCIGCGRDIDTIRRGYTQVAFLESGKGVEGSAFTEELKANVQLETNVQTILLIRVSVLKSAASGWFLHTFRSMEQQTRVPPAKWHISSLLPAKQRTSKSHTPIS